MYDVIHICPALCLCLAAFLKQGIVFIKEIYREWVHTMSPSGTDEAFTLWYILNSIYQEFVSCCALLSLLV